MRLAQEHEEPSEHGRRHFRSGCSGSRFSIMDVYSNCQTFGMRFINWIGAGYCTWPVWRELERLTPSFAQEKLRPFRFLDISVLVSSGTKGEAAAGPAKNWRRRICPFGEGVGI